MASCEHIQQFLVRFGVTTNLQTTESLVPYILLRKSDKNINTISDDKLVRFVKRKQMNPGASVIKLISAVMNGHMTVKHVEMTVTTEK